MRLRPSARASALAILSATPLLVPALHAQTVRCELAPAQSRVWFEESATMGRFQGVAGQVSGWAGASDTVAFGGTRGQTDVGAGSFGTGVALRNQHLRNEMEVERYPFVHFVLEGAAPGEADALMLRGRLVVKDRSTPVTIRARTTRSAGEVILDGELHAMARRRTH